MPKIFALRDRLIEVQQSLTNDENDVRGKRNVEHDDNVEFEDHFSGSSSKSFGFQMFSNFDSIFERKTKSPWLVQSTSSQQQNQEPILTTEGKISNFNHTPCESDIITYCIVIFYSNSPFV